MTILPDTEPLTTSYTLDQALDDAVRDTDAKITRTDSKASLFSELLGSRGGRWRSFVRTRRFGTSLDGCA
ncbi:hypothetical protein OHB00_49930 [Streptomyces sp. NBC_00631]|uniref:hypothetical protein n=1 Tax=Streptomyces sp. NBC_00631 TaxID=2975793 RepID=UPI0030E0BD03